MKHKRFAMIILAGGLITGNLAYADDSTTSSQTQTDQSATDAAAQTTESKEPTAGTIQDMPASAPISKGVAVDVGGNLKMTAPPNQVITQEPQSMPQPVTQGGPMSSDSPMLLPGNR